MSSTRDRYLRNRPFLIINNTYEPSGTVRTEVKGWKDQPGALTNLEQPLLVDRVQASHLSRASVIIDVLNKKIVKNRYEEDPTAVMNHYLNKYKSAVMEAIRVWIDREAANLATSFSAEEIAEIRAKIDAKSAEEAAA